MKTKMDKHTKEFLKKLLLNLRPPENITISEWADKYRRLPPEGAAEPGRWKTSKTPYLKKIMDSVSDPTVRKVVIMSSAQVGKSELLINILGYFIHIDPSAILMVQPTERTAKEFAKRRITTSIRDTPILNKLIKWRESTVLEKVFTGGYLSIIGSNSPSGLASKPIRVVLCDEVDRYELSAGDEGDPLSLVEKRTTTFPDSHKLIYVSTPTIKHVSRIEQEYELGSMEEWQLQCPSCGEYQTITWDKINYIRDEKTKKLDKNKEVLCMCEHCDELNNEYAWKKGEGRWKARNENAEVKSFHLSSLVSPWKTWVKIAEDFINAKNTRDKLRVFINTDLGETFEVLGASIDTMKLFERREKYSAELPKGVLVLTAGVDIQDDRFEIEVVGWGRNYESWGIEYKKIFGNMDKEEVWKKLDEYLRTTFKFADGTELNIAYTCLDTGGHYTSEAYKFLRKPRGYRLRGIKGMGGDGLAFLHKRSKLKDHGDLKLQILGVDSGKETVMGRLGTEIVGEGYCHFPISRETRNRGYDFAYFEGLTSEHQVTKRERGRQKAVWMLKKDGTRNEPFDVRNYATAALELLNPNFNRLEKLLEKGVNHSKPKEKKKKWQN